MMRKANLPKGILLPCIGFFLFALLLACWPEGVGLAFYYGFPVVLFALATLYSCCTYLPRRIIAFAFLLLVIFTFLSPLLGLWHSGISNCLVIGGLLPFNDTAAYYTDALRLLNGVQFSAMSSNRPLPIGILSSLLGLTSENLKMTLVILVLLNALCCWLAIREVQHTHGYFAGFAMFLLIFLFYRRFVGTPFTENIGLATGCLAFTLFWRSVRKESASLCLLGILVLTFSLFSRAGAFVVLPFILVWGTLNFRKDNFSQWRFLSIGIACVVAICLLNAAVLKIAGAPGARGFSNYSYTLYGILTASRWDAVYTYHPEINSLVEPERSLAVYSLAMEILRSDPLSLLKGIYRAWTCAFLPPDLTFSLFSFIFNHPSPETSLLVLLGNIGWGDGIRLLLGSLPLRTSMNVLSGIALLLAAFILSFIYLISLLKNRADKHHSLMAAALLGIFFSLPFAPVWDADYMRVYASTMPFLCCFPALGLALIMGRLKQFNAIVEPEETSNSVLPVVLSVLLVIFSLAGPLFIKTFVSAPNLQTSNGCMPLEETCMLFSPGSTVFLPDSSPGDRTPFQKEIRRKQFKDGMFIFKNVMPEQALPFLAANSLSAVTLSIDLRTNTPYYFFFTKPPDLPAGLIRACGKDAGKELYWGVRIFEVESFQAIRK